MAPAALILPALNGIAARGLAAQLTAALARRGIVLNVIPTATGWAKRVWEVVKKNPLTAMLVAFEISQLGGEDALDLAAVQAAIESELPADTCAALQPVFSGVLNALRENMTTLQLETGDQQPDTMSQQMTLEDALAFDRAQRTLLREGVSAIGNLTLFLRLYRAVHSLDVDWLMERLETGDLGAIA